MSYPPPHIHHPTSPHKNTLILLHGTSQTGPSIALPFLSFPFPFPSPTITPSPNQQTPKPTTLPTLFPQTRFIFPTGRTRPLTILSGQETHAWFDMHSFSDRTLGESSSVAGLRESILYLRGLIREEVSLLAGDGDGDLDQRGRVVLAGFSQGCAVLVMGVLSGMFEMEGVRGMVGLSGWMPFRRGVEGAIAACNDEGEDDGGVGGRRGRVREYVCRLLGLESDIVCGGGEGRFGGPVWVGQGEEDGKVKMQWAEEMSGVLTDVGIDVRFHSYPGLGHWWGEEEMVDLAGFLEGVWGEVKG